jgi:hypothetical protein
MKTYRPKIKWGRHTRRSVLSYFVDSREGMKKEKSKEKEQKKREETVRFLW